MDKSNEAAWLKERLHELKTGSGFRLGHGKRAKAEAERRRKEIRAALALGRPGHNPQAG